MLTGTSRQVLDSVGDARYWIEVITELEKEGDWKSVGELMKFHQQMRDGRPHQNINISSIGVVITADEVSKARAVARELTNPNSSIAKSNDTWDNPKLGLSGEGSPDVPQRKNGEQPNALATRRGQEKVERGDVVGGGEHNQ